VSSPVVLVADEQGGAGDEKDHEEHGKVYLDDLARHAVTVAAVTVARRRRARPRRYARARSRPPYGREGRSGR
jgi:hypothetical protein